MKALPSFLKDTTQLINDLSKLVVKPEIIVVTVDVKSLYTCIPMKRVSMPVLKHLRKSFKEKNPNQPDTETLVNLLQIVLIRTTRLNLMVNVIHNYKGQQWEQN